jgi:DNA adenine methylase
MAAPNAAPLFRWAGGKRRFLQRFGHRLPTIFNRYYEPFAGGLSTYFFLARRAPRSFEAHLGDTDLRVIRTYQAVKKDPGRVARELDDIRQRYETTIEQESFYYAERDTHNSISPKEDAARFIFLMAAGWNGVYRLNAKGEFKVPWGKKPVLALPSHKQLHAISLLFMRTTLVAANWETSIATAGARDLVFLDPPYMATNESRDLYDTRLVFEIAQQERLARRVQSLFEAGAFVLLTNGYSQSLKELYQDLRLKFFEISAMRSVGSLKDSRRLAQELIVTNLPWEGTKDG